MEIELRCDLGGQYDDRYHLIEQTRRRKSGSRLQGCPYEICGRRFFSKWILEAGHQPHNHPPSQDTRSHPLPRMNIPLDNEVVDNF